ncbi:hypothetical protein LTR27_006640 [Elasticomyces elasticus]|nr:hypothetical protein LTR27_006640 [Elasticomyces elasticus]
MTAGTSMPCARILLCIWNATEGSLSTTDDRADPHGLVPPDKLEFTESHPVIALESSCGTLSTHTAPQSCRLLTIAAELRNKIYELALNEVNIGLVDLLSAGSPNKNLLLTCHQALDEAKGIYASACRRYWGETNFILRRNGTRYHNLPVSFTEHELAHIRHVQYSTTFGRLQRGGIEDVTLPAQIPDDQVHGFRCLFTRLPGNTWWCPPTAAEPSRSLMVFVGVSVGAYVLEYYEEVTLEDLHSLHPGGFAPIDNEELNELMGCDVVLRGTWQWNAWFSKTPAGMRDDVKSNAVGR